MDPTTLVTFIFRAPPEVRTIELLGSWDNFTQPYQMHHDRRRGKGSWSGCFKFANIIFDGDTTCWTKPRSGGLKQGGVYWYYYRLDYDVEAYDDSREWTAHCPMMPGQAVNVLEVPSEVVEPPSRSRSAGHWELEGTLSSWSGPMQHRQTLDPSDKFAALAPPPLSKVHERCVSDLALNGQLDGRAASPVPSIVSPLGTPCGEDEQPAVLESHPYDRLRAGDGQINCAHSSIVDEHAASSPEREKHHEVECLPDPPRSHLQSYLTLATDIGKEAVEPTHAGPEDEIDAGEESDDSSVFGPRSIRNVQVYGSRPTTSDSGEQWRPRVHSFQSGDLHAHDIALVSDPGESAGGPQSNSPSSQSSPVGEDRSPVTDRGTFLESDVWSPTFSAATVSSNSGGLNSPFRLSSAYSRGTHHEYSNDQHALADIAERLQSLSAGSSAHDPAPHNPAVFTGYALPTAAIESGHSVSKLSSSRNTSLAYELSLPTFLLESQTGASMTDDFFSELGYLGGSIS
ncbi:hypothetical protein LTR36_003370 [Oleoguttula mirabilis]|uniref:Uncharacterized protein n=1 Tax=Oleoguttula mirabilis TaxID=1507867 RepID=A0AAV9JIE7_9PEZI|nr:hypothetical protein LTR36_003370 [Oleoguttula mirabilis]